MVSSPKKMCIRNESTNNEPAAEARDSSSTGEAVRKIEFSGGAISEAQRPAPTVGNQLISVTQAAINNTATKSTQTCTSPADADITVGDLTSDTVGENYYKIRARFLENVRERDLETIARLKDKLTESKAELCATRSELASEKAFNEDLKEIYLENINTTMLQPARAALGSHLS